MINVQIESEYTGIANVIPVYRAAHDVHGSEGDIYLSIDGQYCIKVLRSSTFEQMEHVRMLIKHNHHNSDTAMLWPLGMVKSIDDEPCFGIIMKRAPEDARTLSDLIFSPVEAFHQFKNGWTWKDYVQLAKNIANAIHHLHDQGFIHNDLHFDNILVDNRTKEIYIIDLDGAFAYTKQTGKPKGKWGFIAPEIVLKETPTLYSDVYSLGVVLLWTLLFRNVMLPQVCFDELNQLVDYKLAYGYYAAFSEHPTDNSNWHRKIGVPLYHKGALSYKDLPYHLRRLTEKTFIEGLHSPKRRPMANEWAKALMEAETLMICCENIDCEQYFFSQHVHTKQLRCPFCGTTKC